MLDLAKVELACET